MIPLECLAALVPDTGIGAATPSPNFQELHLPSPAHTAPPLHGAIITFHVLADFKTLAFSLQ